MSSIVLLLLICFVSGEQAQTSTPAPPPSPSPASDDADLFDAPPDVGRNIKYYNFINTDVLHAACYYTFCACGKEPFAGHQSDIHEISCDSHRIGMSDKWVYKCSKPNEKCSKNVTATYGDLFKPLFKLILGHDLDDKSCKFYVSTCYGMLIKVVLKEFYQPNSIPLSYLLRPFKQENGGNETRRYK